MLVTVKQTVNSVFLWQEFTTHFITKATPIGYIDSKYHIKKLKGSETFLIGYSDLNVNGFNGLRANTYTNKKHVCMPRLCQTSSISINIIPHMYMHKCLFIQ